MYHSIIGSVLFSILLWNLVKCQVQIHTQMRFIKAVDCSMAGLKWIMKNISLQYEYPKTYMNARFDITENIKEFKKIYLHIERCNEQGYDCEDFQNWTVDRFCRLMRLKNQVWSQFVGSIYPTFGCPIKKRLVSEIRFTRVANCNKTGLKWYLENITFVSQYPKMLISGVQNVTGEIKKLNGMNMRFERCNDQGFNCEDFQNWNVHNFCPMLNWKNQVWSGFIDAVYPPFKCPIKKMVYEIRNATIDVNAAMKWYPECVNYRWKVLNEYFDERNSVVFCAIFEAHIYQYTRRNRNKPH